MRSREALVRQSLAPDHYDKVYWQRAWITREGGDGLPASNDPAWMARMDAWSRRQVCHTDLLSCLDFDTNGGLSRVWHRSAVGRRPIASVQRPTMAVLRKQSSRVEVWSALRAERAAEIHAQLAPQFAFWSSVMHLHPASTPYTIELLMLALKFASSVVQRLKFALACPRPADLSPRIQPMIAARGFYALPSGHATEAFMVAHLLPRLVARDGWGLSENQELTAQLGRQAERIATNRVVAGVHFHVDSGAGLVLGRSLAEYLCDVCEGSGWSHRCFDGTQFGDSDFVADVAGKTLAPDAAAYRMTLRDGSQSPEGPPDQSSGSRPGGLPTSPCQWLWRQAAAEWRSSPAPQPAVR
jgi:hypothetical protein